MANDVPRPQEWPPGPKQRMQRNFEFFDAPAVVFLCLHKDLSPWSYFDMGLYAQSLMLAAMEYSVGSVVAVNFAAYPDIIREELGVPEDYAVMIGIALGYEDPKDVANQCRSIRRPVEDAVTISGL